MINKHDVEEMAQFTAQTLRTKMQHRSVDMTGDDFDAILNFSTELMSKYVDNQHVLDKQINPVSGVAEQVNEPQVT